MVKKKPIILNFADFQVDSKGDIDSTQALMLALETAQQFHEPIILNIPQGKYHFWKHHASPKFLHISNTSSLDYPVKFVSVLINNLNHLTIEGNHSQFIFHGDHMAFGLLNSNNITLRNLSIDYQTPDTIDITIINKGFSKKDGYYTDFFIPKCFSYDITDKQTITWYGEINPDTQKPFWKYTNADFIVFLVIFKAYNQTIARAPKKQLSNPFKDLKFIKKISSNIIRIYYHNEYPLDQEIGNTFLLCDSATRKTSGIFISQSENIVLDNVHIHYLSGFGLLAQMSKNLTFDHVQFLPRKGSSKLTTSNADQLHFAGIGGEIQIKNCRFALAHDDPINIHGTYLRVEKVLDSRTVLFRYIHKQQGGFQQFFPNNEVLFYSRNDLQLIPNQTETSPLIVKKSYPPGTYFKNLALDWQSEVVEFTSDLDYDFISELNRSVQLSRNGTNSVENIYVAENITYTPKVRIENNWFKSIPTRGILATTRKSALIKNNYFENISMANIFLSNDAEYWYESGPIRSMFIEGNQFILRNSAQREWNTVPALLIDPVLLNIDKPSKQPIHRNIHFKNNHISLGNDNFITGSHIDYFKIESNNIHFNSSSYHLELNLPKYNFYLNEQPFELSITLKKQNLKDKLIELKSIKNLSLINNKLQNKALVNTSFEPISDYVQSIQHLEIDPSRVKYWTDRPDILLIENDSLIAKGNGKANLIAYYWHDYQLFTSIVHSITIENSIPDHNRPIKQEPFLDLVDYIKINGMDQTLIGNISQNYWESHFIKLNKNDMSLKIKLSDKVDNAELKYSFTPHENIEQKYIFGNLEASLTLPNGITHLQIDLQNNNRLITVLYLTVFVTSDLNSKEGVNHDNK